MVANIILAPWAFVLLEERARYKVIYGGRGSGKSWQIARCLLILAMQKKTRILCAREIQKSIRESVYTLLLEQIKELKLWGWEDTKTSIVFKPNGSEFLFVGLWRNVESVQSMEGIDICWVEEAQKVSNHSWKVLIPTIRRAGSEIWVSFNPQLEDDPTAVRFLQNTPPNTILLKVNWQHNPWLPTELREEAEHLKATDPEEYMNVWEGQYWSRSDAQIFNKKWKIQRFTPGMDWVGPFHGIDFGFSTTPTCMGRQWVFDDCLWVEKAYGGLRIETVDLPDYMDKMVPEHEGAKCFTWRADSARPETISFLNNAGYTVIGAEKGPGSVEDGISFMKSFRHIILHPDATMAIDQIRLYRYKTDKHTGEVLKVIEKKYDDWSDQCRYAIEPVIKGRLVSMNDVLLELPMSKRLVKKLGTALSQTTRPAVTDSASAEDGLSNFVAGLAGSSLRNTKAGIGTARDLRMATDYVTVGAINKTVLENIFRNSWLGRRIISTLPEDMLRAWRKVKWDDLGDDDTDVKKFQRAEKRLKVKKTLLTALNWARLYGGAVIIPILKSQSDEVLSEPLELDSIVKDDLVGFRVLDRWRVSHDGTLVTDGLSPQNGMPEYYRIAESSVRLHYSRVIRVDGRELPYWLFRANALWHDSVLQILVGNLKQYDTAVAALTTMMFQLNVDVISQANLRTTLGTKGGEAKAIERFQQFAMTKAFNGIALLDKDTETFERHPYTFSGVSDAFEKVMYDVCGAADVPFTRLFGQAPAGMNATGESDTRNYYDHVGARREEQADDPLGQMDQITVRSELGHMPEGFESEWNPLWQESASEAAQAENTRANTAKVYVDMGAIDEGLVAGDLYRRGVYGGMTKKHVDNAELAAKEPDPEPLPGMGDPRVKMALAAKAGANGKPAVKAPQPRPAESSDEE